MSRPTYVRALVLAVVSSLISLMGVVGAAPGWASIAGGQQGINLQPRSSTDFGSDRFRQSLADFAVTGGDFADFVVLLEQPDIHSCDIRWRHDNNDDTSLRTGLRNARLLGLKRSIKIQLEVPGGVWRARIVPDDPACWQKNWNRYLLHYAKIAQEEDVELYVIGAEQRGTLLDSYRAGNAARWIDTVKQVRAIYKGKVTYSANRLHESLEINKDFVKQLDYMGVSFYPSLEVMPSVVNFKRELERLYQKPWLDQVYLRYNRKPILVVETGFRSTTHAQSSPWDFKNETEYKPELQAQLYDAMFSFLNDRTYIAGVHTWKWDTDPEATGQRLTYPVQGKPAEAVQARWFGGKVPQQITVWWPTEDAKLTGTTAVKARLLGQSTSADVPATNSYSMSYRVDRGAWVSMKTSAVTGSHKEAALNPSSWSAGKHVVEIRAWDLEGKTLAITLREVVKG